MLHRRHNVATTVQRCGDGVGSGGKPGLDPVGVTLRPSGRSSTSRIPKNSRKAAKRPFPSYKISGCSLRTRMLIVISPQPPQSCGALRRGASWHSEVRPGYGRTGNPASRLSHRLLGIGIRWSGKGSPNVGKPMIQPYAGAGVRGRHRRRSYSRYRATDRGTLQ